MKSITVLPVFLFLFLFVFVVHGSAQDAFHDATRKGNFEASVAQWSSQLESEPANDQLRFQKGTLQFFYAIERMGQSWYRYGIRNPPLAVPFLRLPVPLNPEPEPISYEQFRDVLRQFLADLADCEKTLAQIKTAGISMSLEVANVGLDIDSDGRVKRNERLHLALTEVAGFRFGVEHPELIIRFDDADVFWLRGYCHALSAIAELVLSYDQRRIWDVGANQFFANSDAKFGFSKEELGLDENQSFTNSILDIIAIIHETRMELIDAEGVRRSREHLLQMIAMSREMWARVLKETDNDREWIPNPHQDPPVPGAEITEEMVAGWQEFLDEFEDILEGRKLVPFWRGTDARRGVNLHKAFTEPQDLDLILWIHGAGAFSYLQDDIPVTDPEVWQRINQVFRGQFIGFAVWIN